MSQVPNWRRRGDPYAYRGPRPVPHRHVETPAPADEHTANKGAGLEYAHLLIPRANDLRPALPQIAALIDAWIDAGYIAGPKSAALSRLDFKKSVWTEAAANTGATVFKTRIDFHAAAIPFDTTAQAELQARDYRLMWPLQTTWSAGLKYPLTQMPRTLRGTNGPGYTLEIHSLSDYVYLTSELIDPFPTTDLALKPVHCKVSGTNLHYVAERIDNMFDLVGSRIRHVCPVCGTIFRPQERTVAVKDGWSGAVQRVAGGATYRFAIVIDCGQQIPDRGPVAVVPEFAAIAERVIGQPFYEIGNAY